MAKRRPLRPATGAGVTRRLLMLVVVVPMVTAIDCYHTFAARAAVTPAPSSECVGHALSAMRQVVAFRQEKGIGGTAAAPPETRAEISLADIAGKWKVRTMDEAGGNIVESELTATADTSGWTLTRPNGKTVPVHVVAGGGDSITEAGPYESALRKGVQVRARTVIRIREGKLVGSTEARYSMKGGDSVANRPTEGTRAP